MAISMEDVTPISRNNAEIIEEIYRILRSIEQNRSLEEGSKDYVRQST
jgi:hypothetical protein